MAESEEELMSFLMKVKEDSERAGLKVIILNARLGEAEARIKIARRNINNLRYPDDTTLMAESEEELRAS